MNNNSLLTELTYEECQIIDGGWAFFLLGLVCGLAFGAGVIVGYTQSEQNYNDGVTASNGSYC